MTIMSTVLQSAASSLLGEQLMGTVVEKINVVARDKLGLPPEAPESEVDRLLSANPNAVVELQEIAASIRIKQERSYQTAVRQQGESERVSLNSSSAYVRNARPTMIYLGGFSCFAIILLGGLIAWFRPEGLPAYVNLVSAASMPLTALMTAGGVYAYRRTTDKAITKGVTLPSLLTMGK